MKGMKEFPVTVGFGGRKLVGKIHLTEEFVKDVEGALPDDVDFSLGWSVDPETSEKQLREITFLFRVQPKRD
jgi:hypothetical protein